MRKHIISPNILYAKTHYRFKIHCIAEANLHEGCVADQKTLQSMNVSYQSYHGVFFLCYGNESSATCLHDYICVPTSNQYKTHKACFIAVHFLYILYVTYFRSLYFTSCDRFLLSLFAFRTVACVHAILMLLKEGYVLVLISIKYTAGEVLTAYSSLIP